MYKNTEHSYGLIAIVFHWLTAIAIVGLFILGTWMVDLDYYHEWYKTAPDSHRSIGVLLAVIMVLRFALRLLSPTPKPEPGIKHWEQLLARSVHWLLYLLILVVIISGYLISTADGRAVGVFNWFEIPATVTSIENQEDLAGELHYYLAISLIVLASIHALAALKHHFIDKNATLKKMLGVQHNSTNDHQLDN